MKQVTKLLGYIMVGLLLVGLTACASSSQTGKSANTRKTETVQSTKASSKSSTADTNMSKESSMATRKLLISFNDYQLEATFEDNSSAKALMELLEDGPLTLDMHDYSNFEKVGDLPKSLPQNNQSITTQAGDVILYQGNELTIYYDTNSWNFTRIAKIDDPSGLKSKLGSGNVSVTFSLK